MTATIARPPRHRRARQGGHRRARFTWDYERAAPPLVKLYEKAKTSQWNVSTDLDWSIDVDPEKIARRARRRHDRRASARSQEVENSPVRTSATRSGCEVGVADPELAAVAVPARRAGRAALHRPHRRDRAVDRREVLRGHAGDGRGPPRRGVRPLPRREAVEPVPINHEPEVAARRHPRRHPLGHHLPRHADHGRGPRARGVRDDAADHQRAVAEEAAPLRDERRGASRRVRCALAAGVLRRSSPTAELRERQEFAFDAACRLQQRFMQAEVWERMGVDPKAVRTAARREQPAGAADLPAMLFSKIVPNCKKLGLLDAADGWLRERFTETGVIQFEDWTDTGEEYADARRGRRDHGPRPPA